jgi:hypothetical protein
MQPRMKTASYVVYNYQGAPVYEVYELHTVAAYRSRGNRVVSILTHLQELNRKTRERLTQLRES